MKFPNYILMFSFALLVGCAGAPFSGTTFLRKKILKEPKLGNEYSFSTDRFRGNIAFSDENFERIGGIARFEVINDSAMPMTVVYVADPRRTSAWSAPISVAPMSRKLLFEGVPRDISVFPEEPRSRTMNSPLKGRLIFKFVKGPLPKEVRIFDVLQGDVL